jgi:hypothetical protein
MKKGLESAKRQSLTIDGTSGTCTPTPPKIKLTELEDVRREMARVYREARGGKTDTSDAGRLTYMLVSIGKLIEASVIEKRLEQLERTVLK